MTSISGKTDPVVRRITAADVIDALSKGLRDFQAKPLYGLALGAFYALGGVLIVLSATAFGMSYLSYPLAAGSCPRRTRAPCRTRIPEAGPSG